MIRDRNIAWKYGYKFIHVFNMNGWTATNSDLSLASSGAMAEVLTALQITGMTMADGDLIHDFQLIEPWGIDKNHGMDFRVVFVNTSTGKDTGSVWKLDYLFLTPGDTLATPVAATETVSATATVDSSGSAGSFDTTPWTAMDTTTYLVADDIGMIWSIKLDANGESEDDELDLLGVEFRWTRADTTDVRQTTA